MLTRFSLSFRCCLSFGYSLTFHYVPAVALGLFAAVLFSPVAVAKPVRVILVGDSTMASRTGYGDALCQRLPADVTCINLARGGRSSGSFRAEGRWDQVQALLRDSAPYSASYVLLQFGHNDQPGKPGRSTDLVTEFPVNMARYVDQVRALGAHPVLVTPLTRRTFKGAWLHDDLAPWAAAVRSVAHQRKAALIDLNKTSAAVVQAMGQRQADTLAQEAPGPLMNGFDRTHVGREGAALFSRMVEKALRKLAPGVNATPASLLVEARLRAPVDGWAAQAGGTHGGAMAASDKIFTVRTRAELLAALESGADDSKIIQVAGLIDMSAGAPFTSSADQAQRGAVKIPSNTTLIGSVPGAGFVNASLLIAKASQVIVRQLRFRNPCDVAPVWDAHDGAKGNWNALFDSVVVSGSHHVWIDHNSFSDGPDTDDTLATENGMLKQCHDGALDITHGSDFVTVSYNHFALHEKNMLIGSSDKATGDDGKLRVTLSNNLFEQIAARSPRVRFGQVHAFNNYHAGERKRAVYAHEYSIGIGKQAKVISHHNAFAIDGARTCAHIVHNPGSAPAGAFIDTGSTLNGDALAGCDFSASVGWAVPYAFKPLPAAAVPAHVRANAGAPRSLTVAPRSSAAPIDTVLRIVFDRPPTIGVRGAIRIMREADDTPVDIINITNEIANNITNNITALGYPGQDQMRYVRHKAVSIDGVSAIIRPSRALPYAGRYYVLVDDGVFTNASMNGLPFSGIDKAARWRFGTRHARPTGNSVTVDDDGPADFNTVQGALNHVMRHIGKSVPTTVRINNGRYNELLFVRAKDRLTIQGESRDGVLIHATNNESLNALSGVSQRAEEGKSGAATPSGGRALLLIEDADLLTLDTLSLKNTSLRSDSARAQAETLHFNSDQGRLIATNASFISEQDTLQLKGYAWFYRTLIAGNVDFIWGANRAALFEESEIRSIGDSAKPELGGYIVQARTVDPQEPGFVFLNSRLTHGPGPKGNDVIPGTTYLARSAGRAGMWDKVSYINCSMDQHIAEARWLTTPAPNPAGGWTVSAGGPGTTFSTRESVFASYGQGRGWRPSAPAK